MNYPFDIITEFSRNKKGETKTFSIAANLIQETEESPLKFFNSMSRLSTTIIQNGVAASLNLHPSDLPKMRSMTDFVMSKYHDRSSLTTDSDPETNPAFTKRFLSGTLKGKTPVDVLIENKALGRKMLNDQYIFLKSNIDKYPKNRELMDAIVAAANLDFSELSSKTTAAAPSYTIVKIGCRGNIRKKRGDGKCPCYDGEIVFDLSRDIPVNIHIRNYYAPIIVNKDGTQNIRLSELDKASMICNSFSMTADSWLNCLKEMEDIVMLFKTAHIESALKLANDAFNNNLTTAKLQQNKKAA